jgi:hypothetical protein
VEVSTFPLLPRDNSIDFKLFSDELIIAALHIPGSRCLPFSIFYPALSAATQCCGIKSAEFIRLAGRMHDSMLDDASYAHKNGL